LTHFFKKTNNNIMRHWFETDVIFQGGVEEHVVRQFVSLGEKT
jgi:hypothetical protein